MQIDILKINKLGIKMSKDFSEITKAKLLNMVTFIFKEIEIDIILLPIKKSLAPFEQIPTTNILEMKINHKI